jgi:hypothetical protein
VVNLGEALAMLREIAGGDFAGLAEAKAEAAGMTLLGRQDPVVTALGRAVLPGMAAPNDAPFAEGPMVRDIIDLQLATLLVPECAQVLH